MNPRCSWLLAVCFAAVSACVFVANAADPSALWHIVSERCVPHAAQGAGPEPCTEVNLAGGYAVLKDIVGATQFLLIPVARVSGIEDPAVLAPGAPNYWAAAWRARRFLDQKAGHEMPRDTISLAINSAYGRTQDQLHIHIDCIDPGVRDMLRASENKIGVGWIEFPQPLAGSRYRAMRIEQRDLDSADPFRLLALDVKQEDMGKHTLVLAGAVFTDGAPGFILLDGHMDLAAGDRGSGETLQDHGCTLAR